MISRNPLKLGQIEDGIALREENNTFTENNEFVKPVKVADGVDDTDAVNKGWVNNQFIPKSGNATKSGTLTFEDSPKVPMGTQPDDAINLAQLTASNPIALNKVVDGKLVDHTTGAISIKLDGDNFIEVPEGLLNAVGSVVEATVSFNSEPLISGGSYVSFLGVNNFGLQRGITTEGSTIGSPIQISDFKIIIVRDSQSTVSVSSYYNEYIIEEGSSTLPYKEGEVLAERVGRIINYSMNNNIGDDFLLRMVVNVRTGSEVHSSPLIIQKIK